MKRAALVLFGLTLLIQPVAVSADMVVYWGIFVCDRSTLFARVMDQTGQIKIQFVWGPGLAAEERAFLCSDKWDDEKAIKSTEVILNSLDKDKKVSPVDILKKAGLTGCKLVKK